jgi:GntR family transcriptional regulator, frlABCD operon transcriptional regulator
MTDEEAQASGDDDRAATEFDKLRPLYEQVKERLVAALESGLYKEGEFLPPEPELCERFGVSRITLRRAVAELCEAGLLVRQQGRGTIVAPRKVRQALVSLSGSSEALEGLGKPVEHRILDRQDGIAEADVGIALGYGTLTPLARFTRLILADGRPMTIETLYLHAERFAGVFDAVAGGGSFFQALREAYGIEPVAAERFIDVGFPTPEERRQLGIGSSQPVYRMEKTVFGPDGGAISWSRLVTPTHLVTYSIWTGPSGRPA